MPQIETVPKICPKCGPEFAAQRTHYCREYLRYQRENFAQRGEISALEFQLKNALQKLLNADRRYDEIKHSLQRLIDAERCKAAIEPTWAERAKAACTPL